MGSIAVNGKGRVSNMDRTRLSAVIAGGIAVAFLVASAGYVLLSRPSDAFSECRQSNVAGSATIGGPFTLIDETGATVTDADVLTEPTLVYFGYTFCPDVCPFDMARNVEAIEILRGQGYSANALFISIDPERDTPEVLSEWTDYLHPDLVGLTGSPEQVKAASQAYRTYYKRQPSEDEFYLVDHSVFTYLMMPDTGFAEFFGRDVTPDDMAKRAACFIDAAQ